MSGEPAGAGRPHRSGATGSVFVGRQAELAEVVAALWSGPALVLVEGEAGIGKTRLVRECLASEPPVARTALVVSCPPLAQPFPLGPVVDGLRRLGQRFDDLELSPLAGALRPLFPEWADRLPPALEPLGDPNETRHRLLRALTELVDRLDVDLLVVEDAHWSDTATLEWLLTLCADSPAASVVVTYRNTDVPAGSPLLRLTSRAPAGMAMVRLALDPLDLPHVREMVDALLDAESVSEQFATLLHERTAGLPLAVEECLRLLHARRDVLLRDGRWTRQALDALELPPTLRDSVIERVDRLDHPARAVLEAAAVLSGPSDQRVLAAVAGLTLPATHSGVATALSSGLLREAGTDRFVFRHALAAQAVHESIPVSERRHLHSRAARCLRQLEPTPVVRLSRHLREAGEFAAWAHYAEASAELALASGDNRTAVAVLLDLLDSVDHPDERRTRLARQLGEAAYLAATAVSDIAPQVVAALRQVLDEGVAQPGERGEIRLLLGRMLREISMEPEAYAALEAAVDDLADRPDLAVRAMANLAMPLVPDWPAARHLSWLDRASALLPQVESDADRLPLAFSRATTLLLLGEDAGWQAAAEIPTDATSPPERLSIARGLLNTAQVAVVWGRQADVRPRLSSALEHMHAVGYERLLGTARVTAALDNWYTGDWDGLADEVAHLVVSETSVPMDHLIGQQIQGALAFARGERSVAERHLVAVRDTCARLGVVDPSTPMAAATLARLRLADGAPARAVQATHRDVTIIAGKGVWWWAADVAPVTVDALVRAGRLHQAMDLVERFVTGLGRRGGPAPAAALLLCRALVTEGCGSPREAAELFAAAASAWAELPRPYDELLTLERAGRCLLAAGMEQPGLERLSEAQGRLRRLGAAWDADRVALLLRQHGVGVARTWRRGPRGYGNQLSPREREVVGLVAQGMTNRQIGETLFLSSRTVGHHLGAAMRKLGVSTRTAVAVAAADAGLIADDTRPVGER